MRAVSVQLLLMAGRFPRCRQVATSAINAHLGDEGDLPSAFINGGTVYEV